MEENVSLVVDGQRVGAVFFKPTTKPKKIAMLFLHGWTGKPNLKAGQLLATHGYYSLALIMRGHKGSDGDLATITAANSLDDAVAAYDYLEDKLSKDVKIVAVGNSYGSYIAVLLSGLRHLAGLSLRVPASYPDGNFNMPKVKDGHNNPVTRAWRTKPTHYSDNRAFQLLHNFIGYVQILEGQLDDIVPSQTVKNYANAVKDASSLDHRVMKGWTHSIGSNERMQQEFEKVLLEWLEQMEQRV